MTYTYSYYPYEDFDTYVQQFDNYSLLQSREWTVIKEDSWDGKTILFYEDKKVVGTALILIREIAFNKKMIYVPYGPLFDYSNKELFNFVTNSLKEIGKENNAIFVKVVPPVFNDNSISADFKINGWVENVTEKSFDSIQPKLNAVVNKDFNLTKRMKQNLRTVENKNVTAVYSSGCSGEDFHRLLDDFYYLTRCTEDRQGIKLRSIHYFIKLLQRYPNSFITVSYINKDKQIAKLKEELSKSYSDKLKDELEKLEKRSKSAIPISGTLTVMCGDTAELLYAGFNDNFKSYNAPFYSWTKSIQRAFEINPNLKYVNLGGVENDGHLLNFKKKFHPEIRTSCNEFDLPISPLYYLFKFALKHKKLILKFIKK